MSSARPRVCVRRVACVGAALFFGCASKLTSVTPHIESTEPGSAGTNEVCHVYLYAWDAAKPGCTVSLTHCNSSGQCVATADERHAACGKTLDVCGDPVRCDCPIGAPPTEADEPGTVVLEPGKSGIEFGSSGCTAVVSGTPEGKGLGTCELDVHDCAPAASCEGHELDMFCGISENVCGRKVLCRCSKKH
jgi:hypothetical protein